MTDFENITIQNIKLTIGDFLLIEPTNLTFLNTKQMIAFKIIV